MLAVTLETVGGVVSTTRAAFAPRDPAAPVVASVRVAALAPLSMMVPPLSARALVE